MTKKTQILLLSIFSIYLLIPGVVCAEIKHEYPKSREERQAEELGSILGAEGLSFNPTKIGKTSTQSAAANINSYLWEAALEILSFVPLASTDAVGGVIVTEWYTPKKAPKTSMKIVANIKGNTIDPVNITIKIYTRKKSKGEWLDQNQPSQALTTALEEKILRKARSIFLQTQGEKQ